MSETLQYSRDSFERFGDDLCEEMLSCLSFDDCFAYECVSKTWKRVIFNGRNRAVICLPSNKWSSTKHDYCPQLKSKLESITKKCLFIKDICMPYIGIHSNIFSYHYLNTIRENCHHLKSISFDLESSSCDVWSDSWRMFGEKFGPHLLKITIWSENQDLVKKLLRLTPNLIECRISDINACLEYSGEEFLTKLKVISTSIDSNSKLEKFAEMYSNRVKDITIIVSTQEDYENQANYLFIQICKFTQLKELYISFTTGTSISTDTLNSISFNCKHLSRLSLEGVGNCADILRNTRQLMTNLNDLRLWDVKLETIDKYRLKFCPNLVHLYLGSAPHYHYDEDIVPEIDIFEGIAENMPKLKSINVMLEEYRNISDSSLQHLSRLKNLISLSIDSFESKITPNGLRQFIASKPDIRELEITCKANTDISILIQIMDAFKDVANCNPKRNYMLKTESCSDDKTVKLALNCRGMSRFESDSKEFYGHQTWTRVDMSFMPKNMKYFF